MLLDMADSIEIELKRMPAAQLKPDLIQPAINMLRASLNYGALCYPPEWFNDDDNFSLVLNMTLYLQRVLVRDIGRLNAALQKNVLDLRGWKPFGPSRIMLVLCNAALSAYHPTALTCHPHMPPTRTTSRARTIHSCWGLPAAPCQHSTYAMS